MMVLEELQNNDVFVPENNNNNKKTHVISLSRQHLKCTTENVHGKCTSISTGFTALDSTGAHYIQWTEEPLPHWK